MKSPMGCPDEIHGGKYRWVCVTEGPHTHCFRKPFPLNNALTQPSADQRDADRSEKEACAPSQ